MRLPVMLVRYAPNGAWFLEMSKRDDFDVLHRLSISIEDCEGEIGHAKIQAFAEASRELLKLTEKS